MSIGDLVKLNRSSRNSVFAALILIAAAAMYNWIVSPHIAHLAAAQQYDSAVDKIVEKNKSVAAELQAKTKKLKELCEQFDRAQGTLFTNEETKKFFSDLQAIPEETGCTVYSLNLIVNKHNPADKRAEDSSGTVANSVMLSVIGQYNSIIKLMEKLQNRAQKVWIDSLKMEIFDFGSAQLKCDMTITIYTVPDKESAL